MLTKHNAYSKKVKVTEIPLQPFHKKGSDIHKQSHIRVSVTVILGSLV